MKPIRYCGVLCALAVHGLLMGQGSWTERAQFTGLERDRSAGFVIGDKAFIACGADDSTGIGTAVLYNDLWEWDAITNSWTQRTSFSGTPRAGAAGFSIGTKGYIGTGWDGFLTSDFWEWDQSANNWTERAEFPGPPRYAGIGFALNGKGYIGMGFDIQSTESFNDLWKYDPDLDQ